MTIHVGVLHMVLRIQGAQSLKDRRKAVVSLRDRIRSRFEVTWNEVEPFARADRCAVVCTTAGTEARLLRSTLDKVRHFVDQSGKAWADAVDVDVFPWHPPDALWLQEDVDG